LPKPEATELFEPTKQRVTRAPGMYTKKKGGFQKKDPNEEEETDVNDYKHKSLSLSLSLCLTHITFHILAFIAATFKLYFVVR